jgi:serine/threonine protein kinase
VTGTSQDLRDKIALQPVSGDVPTDVPPAAFGRFRVLHQIGVGSLGPVFRAEDPETHDAVAIKQFRLNLAPDVAGRVAERLRGLVTRVPDHPAVTRVIDAGLHHLDPYLVTALAPGESLDVALREYGPAAIGDALPRLHRLADALDRSAVKSIWHGALQPRDILVSGRETHMTGLGVAPILDAAGVRRSPRRPYAAPEIVAGGQSSTASDQYALAAIAYEWLFGGRAPRSAESVLDAPALHGVDAEALGQALMTALAANPADRFANCTRFVAAIDAAVRDAAPTPGTGRERAAPVAVSLPLVPDADERLGKAALLPDEQVFEIGPPSLEQSELALDASGPDEFPSERPLDQAPADRSVDDVLRTVDDVPGSRDDVSRSLDDIEPPSSDSRVEDRAPVRLPPVDRPGAVAWQGSLGSSDRSMSDGPRGFTTGTLVAVLLGGLIVGGIAGYLAGATRAGGRQEPIAPPIASESTTPGPQPATPEREATDVPVAAATQRLPEPAPSEPAARQPAPPEPAAAPKPSAPPVPTAQLLVRSSPSGAAVSVDGTPRGTTPLTLRDLALGTRTVLVTRAGFEPAERRITLTADRPSRSVDIRLVQARAARPARETPTPVVASLLVESRPSGATVTIDGKPAGVTPLTVASIAPGTHTIQLELAGYRSLTHTVNLKQGERLRVAASLEGAQ